MILDKKNNVKRGIKYGIINKIVTLLFPFIIQTVTIKTLGAEYAGIKGLYSSILAVLSLSELGIGTAIVYSMYKPIAEDDIETIGALLKIYKRLYRIIGLIVLIVGFALTPFLKLLIKGDYPNDINLYIIFLLYLINTVISYWMYAYKASLLNAYQRIDIISNIGTIIQAITCFFQIAFLIITRNFYLFLIVSIVATVVNNIITSICVDHMYPEIKCKGIVSNEIKKDIKKNVGGLVIGKICGTTRNTFDNIFMSMFLGLKQSTIYSNYFYILYALNGFTGIILDSLLAGVGNSIVIESRESNFKKMMILHTAYMVISGWITICMLCLYQPFMRIWVGDKLMFPEYTMILFPLYFYIGKLGDIRGVYADAAGLFWQNRYRTLIEAIANIILNYIFVLKWGAFGIMLATIITLFFIGFIGSTIVIFKCYYKSGMREYLFNSIFYFMITIILGSIAYLILKFIKIDSLILEMIIRIIACLTVIPVGYVLIVFRRNDFRETVNWIKDAVSH